MTRENPQMAKIKRKNREGRQKDLDLWVVRKGLNIQENGGKEGK